MFERSIQDTELVTMMYICRELKIALNTIHSIQNRFHLLPKPIVANKHSDDPSGFFKRKIQGREVLYSRRTVGYVEKIKKLHSDNIPYNEIAKRKDVLSEKKLIELLHEANLAKDPLKKDDDFYKNFDALLNVFAKRVSGVDLAHYARLSKDAAGAFRAYEAVNRQIGDRAYSGNFKVEDLLKKKQNIAIRLALFNEMIRTVLRKIGDVAAQDNNFKEEVARILRKG